MALPDLQARLSRADVRRHAGTGAPALDWLFAALAGWLVFGMYLDGWAHAHHFVDQSFFTPWHALAYAALPAWMAALAVAAARHRRPGGAWRTALPAGYGLAAVGIGLFALGGVADLLWHEAFGIEAGIEAGLSPPHVGLIAATWLAMAGPLRSAWRRPQRAPSLPALAPALLCAGCLLAGAAFLGQFAHPFVANWAAPLPPLAPDLPPAARDLLGENAAIVRPGLGVTGMLLHAALLQGMVLLLVARWRLPFGALTLLLAPYGLLLGALRDQPAWGLVAAAGGLAADGLLRWLRPSLDRPAALRGFAFLWPLPLFGLLFAVLALRGALAWRAHLSVGTVLACGVVGLLLSYLLVPPVMPGGAEDEPPRRSE